MLNVDDIAVILAALPKESDDEQVNRVRAKLDCLYDQMNLQAEFQERSLRIRKRMEELSK